MADAEKLAKVAGCVDESRLWRMHMDMAAIGATPKGGVRRESLTAEDVAGRRLLADWGRELGCTLFMDDIANMFLRRPGRDSEALAVCTGSHLDSQPTGGRFDGAYGVLAGIEALRAISAAGITTRRPIEVINWTNEEGSRFVPGVMGSQVYVRPHELERMLAVEDGAGLTVRAGVEAVRAALPECRPRPLNAPMHAFLEAHIEQGPVLEQTGNTIGVVTGIQGSRKFSVEVIGEEAHAGTTPRRSRKDALTASVAMITALNRLMEDHEDRVRFTIGRMEVYPGAPSVVPGRVVFSLDFRHPDDALRVRLGDQIEPLCRALAGPCEVTVTSPQQSLSTNFSGIAIEAVRSAVDRLGISHMDIYSGAGHDARNTAAICPTAMVFVPCERGISHNEIENAKPADLAAGARVIAQALVELADS